MCRWRLAVGAGLCRGGVLPGLGRVCQKGLPLGRGLCRAGPPGARGRCAWTAALPGGGRFFPGGGAKNFFFKRPYAHVLGSAADGFRKIGG